jgi:hypothetical protein
MSAMADLDIVLTDYKLSDAQKNAVVELFEGGATVAKTVTFKALERKGLVTMVDGFWQLDAEFRNKLRGEVNPVEDIQAELNTSMWDSPVTAEGDPWKVGEQITADEPYLEFRDEITLEPSPWEMGPETFDKDWAEWETELTGFGETLKWRNTDVWHGLTAEEIREDMDTALPIGRKARRERARIMRKALATV